MNTKKEFKAEEMEERLEMSILKWRAEPEDEGISPSVRFEL